MSWWPIVVLSVGAYAFKAFGLVVLGGRRPGPRMTTVASLLPAALFSGLITLMTVVDGETLVIDARLAGVAAGAVAAWRRAPFVAVIVVAMATTAALRVIG